MVSFFEFVGISFWWYVTYLAISAWKSWHIASFSVTTLALLWFVSLPLASSFLGFDFFILWCVWTLGSVILIVRENIPRFSSSHNSRWAFVWFSNVHQFSFLASAVTTLIIILNIAVAGMDNELLLQLDTYRLIFYYALYFGIVNVAVLRTFRFKMRHPLLNETMNVEQVIKCSFPSAYTFFHEILKSVQYVPYLMATTAILIYVVLSK